MKRFIAIGIMLFFIQSSFIHTNIQSKPNYYMIEVTTIGENALVEAIKKYSDITEADVNRWSFSWIPLLGPNIRNRMINKVKEFLKVCRGLRYTSQEQGHRGSFEVLDNYPKVQKCKAIKNLDKQCESAIALLNRFGNSQEKALYRLELNAFYYEIQSKKNSMETICSQISISKETKSQKKLQAQQNQLKINKIWWETNRLRWKMVKDISSQIFQGVKWIAQTINTNPYPSFLSTLAAWYVYDRMFGTSHR